MALPGNEVHRSSTVSSRSRPLKSSPLAGPAVLGVISLNDSDSDINNDAASLSPSSPSSSPASLLQLPTRPKSVHQPLTTLRSRSRSAQSLTRPVSWYAYPSAVDVGVTSTSVGAKGNGSLHGNEMRSTSDVHLNSRPKSNVNGKGNVNPHRKRPSTAPGPSSSNSSSSEDNDERYLVPVPVRLSVIGTQAHVQQAQRHPLHANLTPLPSTAQVRYSNSPSIIVAASAAGPSISINDDSNEGHLIPGGGGGGGNSGAGVRPTSILLDPDVPQPKPILKHRTSFVVPTSASSSRSSFLSSNSDEFAGTARSRSRLSIVSTASASSSAHLSPNLPPSSHDHPTYIKNIESSESTKESWYTFSPYADTPKFSRLGLASAGVVMPVAKKEAVKVRERRLSAISSTSSNGKGQGKGLERTNTGASTRSRMSTSSSTNRKSTDLPGTRTSMTSMREEEETGEQPERRPPPLPLSSSATSPAPWLNVPATAACGSPAHSSSSSSARTGISASPTGSSRSSPASSVASLHVDANIAGGATLTCGTEGNEGSKDCGEKENQTEEGKIDDGSTIKVSSTTATPRRKPKEKRKSLSISGSLKSWRSLRSTHKSTPGCDVPDVPSLPIDKDHGVISHSFQEKGPGENSKDAPDIVIPSSVRAAVEGGSVFPPQPKSVDTTPIDRPLPPKSDSIEPAILPVPVQKLKKRKSASTLIARVKSWRWKKEEPVCSSGGSKKESEGKEGGAVITAGGVEVCGVEDDRQDDGEVEKDTAGTPSTDIAVVEKLSNVQTVDIKNGAMEDVAVEVDVGVEGRKDVLSDEEEEKEEEGSADSPYPGSTPSSTHSIPSFVPMSMMIPSPNLHVEDGAVPTFIEEQLPEDVDDDALDKSVLIDIEVVPCTPIDDEDSNTSSSPLDEQVEEQEADHEDSPDGVTVTVTPALNVDSESSHSQQAPEPVEESQVVDAPFPVGDLSPDVSPSSNIPPCDPRTSTPESHPPSQTPIPISDPPAPITSSSPKAPTQVPSRPSTPSLSSIHPGRSSTRNRSRSRGRSSSVRRMWNTFICGAADAEQMAVAEAWDEIQTERGRAMDLVHRDKKEEEEEKVENVQIVVVGVDLNVDSKTPLNRPSFSEIGKAL